MTAAKQPSVAPFFVARSLRVLGTHVSNWRKPNRLISPEHRLRCQLSWPLGW
jgi:hypothetical protein